MIIEKFFPTIVYGKDVQLDNNKLAQDIVNWSNQDKGVSKTNAGGWHSTTDMNQKEEYNVLTKVKLHEKNLMRTFYLIRDFWTNEQLKELKEFLDEEIVSRHE